MGRKALSEKDKLQMVAGAVPSDVKTFINRLAQQTKRTVSQVVRELLEESPRVKAAVVKARR